MDVGCVIKGLEKLRENAGCLTVYDCDCKTYPYLKVNGCCEQIIIDALELLKGQETRVLTLEEVVSAAGTPAWFEGKSKMAYTGWVLVYDVQEGMGITGTRVGVTKPGHITIWPATELYGAKWRCWTSRPTDEQREATPWN